MLPAVAGPPHDRKARGRATRPHIHVTADSAYAGEELKKLGEEVTWTTRLRKDAALHGLPPQRTGKARPAPRARATGSPNLAALAATAAFAQVTVTRYGKDQTVHAAASPACGTPSSAPAPSR